MAIQVTVLPNSGFSICLTYNHIAADGKSLHHFMKFWASLSKAIAKNYNNNNFSLEYSPPLDLPSYERNRVKDPKGLKLVYLQQLEDSKSKEMELAGLVQDSYVNKVRTTLILSYEQVQKLKKWVTDKCKDSERIQHLSTFVVTSSLIWFCMIKSKAGDSKSDQGDCVVDDDNCYFVILADCRDSGEFSLPKTYFGNCIASYAVAVKRDELVGINGIVVASNGMEKKIRDFKNDALLGAESLMSNYRELDNKSLVVVAGSPKLAVYETDFGWGKPKKSDAVHLDSSVSISLSDCRDGGGGIEIGLVLERSRMTNFIYIFQEQLDNICSM